MSPLWHSPCLRLVLMGKFIRGRVLVMCVSADRGPTRERLLVTEISVEERDARGPLWKVGGVWGIIMTLNGGSQSHTAGRA
jgi:hypothetical protein